MENLFSAWNEFKKGKERKIDVQEFSLQLEDHLFEMHSSLRNGLYHHSSYVSFFLRDPKLRHIHKAKVADRVLHHAILKVIEPVFEKTFIFDSYSSRKNKGTHKAVKRFHEFARKLSRNNTNVVWVLQCDIRKFFDSVDHQILINLIRKKISDEKTVYLLWNIISSFQVKNGKGMPLGNVTSQLFSNIYLNPLDQFIKRKLRIKYYLRYADDFAILSTDRAVLEKLLPVLEIFLKTQLDLQLHPTKISIRKWNQGIDFLGYISFPFYKIVRTKTRRRMLRKIKEKYDQLEGKEISPLAFNQSLQSYLGILKHCRGHKIYKKIHETIRKPILSPPPTNSFRLPPPPP